MKVKVIPDKEVPLAGYRGTSGRYNALVDQARELAPGTTLVVECGDAAESHRVDSALRSQFRRRPEGLATVKRGPVVYIRKVSDEPAVPAAEEVEHAD